MTAHTYYVTRPNGTPLGTVEATDANDAQRLASLMWGDAYAFPESHVGAAMACLCMATQGVADLRAERAGGAER